MSAESRADVSQRLAHEATRARRNVAHRADGIARMLVAERDTVAAAHRVAVNPLGAPLPERATVRDLMGRLLACLDDIARAMNEAQEAHEAWMGSVLPSVDEIIGEVQA